MSNDAMDPTSVDAHMPPQPEEVAQPSSVFANEWNPVTNEWAPSNNPHAATTVQDPSRNQQPSHGDVHDARPQPSDLGAPWTWAPPDDGSTPDARMNLLDAVKNPRQVSRPPTQIVHHIVETNEVSSGRIRARVVRVQAPAAGGNDAASVVLLEENKDRDRALIKLITTNGVIVLTPMRQGGLTANTAVPAGSIPGFPIATGDPVHEIKSSEGVEAYIANSSGQAFCDVAIWEEMKSTQNLPGSLGS
jgi:hypothetical protein